MFAGGPVITGAPFLTTVKRETHAQVHSAAHADTRTGTCTIMN